jgi:hypothetical protein
VPRLLGAERISLHFVRAELRASRQAHFFTGAMRRSSSKKLSISVTCVGPSVAAGSTTSCIGIPVRGQHTGQNGGPLRIEVVRRTPDDELEQQLSAYAQKLLPAAASGLALTPTEHLQRFPRVLTGVPSNRRKLRYCTITVATMPAWIEQWYVNVPLD